MIRALRRLFRWWWPESPPRCTCGPVTSPECPWATWVFNDGKRGEMPTARLLK